VERRMDFCGGEEKQSEGGGGTRVEGEEELEWKGG